MDFVRPLKFETDIDGTQIDLAPREVNETEDLVLANGIALQEKTVYINNTNNEVTFNDTLNGKNSISDLKGFSIAMSIVLG